MKHDEHPQHKFCVQIWIFEIHQPGHQQNGTVPYMILSRNAQGFLQANETYKVLMQATMCG